MLCKFLRYLRNGKVGDLAMPEDHEKEERE